MTLILALDFGGTKLTAGVVEWDTLDFAAPRWQAHERIFTPPKANRETDIEAMLDLAHRLLADRQPTAVGVSFGGPVAFDRGVVRLSHHVPGWEETPLAAWLVDAFGLLAEQVAVDNDANVAALGEQRFGAGRGVADLLYVTVSTGVGGGWVLGQRPWRGHGGLAGEIGHMVVDPAGPKCLCGKRGCVERLASGPYMAADLAAELGLPSESLSGKDVARQASVGEPAARRILLRGARALGVGLGNAANLVNPQRFILGGGVTKSGDLWWRTVRAAARETALPEVAFEVVPAVLGDDAPLWGAVALVVD